MTGEQLVILRQLIDANGDILSEATHEAAASWLNTKSVSRPKTMAMFTKRTMYERLGLERGVTLMGSLRYLAAQNVPQAPLYAEIVDLLEDVASQGIDLALPEAQSYIHQFHLGGLISEPERDLLLSFASETVTPAHAQGIPEVKYWHVARARQLSL